MDKSFAAITSLPIMIKLKNGSEIKMPKKIKFDDGTEIKIPRKFFAPLNKNGSISLKVWYEDEDEARNAGKKV